MKVLNTLKPGLSEKAYENALVIELFNRGHVLELQRRFEVFFEGVKVDTLIPDLIVDTKVVTEFNDSHVAQMMGYLAILLNFKFSDPRFKRVVR